jgi:hypothetical protein
MAPMQRDVEVVLNATTVAFLRQLMVQSAARQTVEIYIILTGPGNERESILLAENDLSREYV